MTYIQITQEKINLYCSIVESYENIINAIFGSHNARSSSGTSDKVMAMKHFFTSESDKYFRQYMPAHPIIKIEIANIEKYIRRLLVIFESYYGISNTSLTMCKIFSETHINSYLNKTEKLYLLDTINQVNSLKDDLAKSTKDVNTLLTQNHVQNLDGLQAKIDSTKNDLDKSTKDISTLLTQNHVQNLDELQAKIDRLTNDLDKFTKETSTSLTNNCVQNLDELQAKIDGLNNEVNKLTEVNSNLLDKINHKKDFAITVPVGAECSVTINGMETCVSTNTVKILDIIDGTKVLINNKHFSVINPSNSQNLTNPSKNTIKINAGESIIINKMFPSNAHHDLTVELSNGTEIILSTSTKLIDDDGLAVTLDAEITATILDLDLDN